MSSDSCACTKGHDFAYFAAPQSIACAACGQHVPTGKFFFGCGECDRDICASCYADPDARNSKVAPGAAATLLPVSKDKACVSASKDRVRHKSISTPCTGKRCGMSFLEVSSPVAPRPQPRMSLETTTTFRIPDADTFLDESDECEPGAHSFSRYAASNALCCDRCNQQVRPGKYVHSCEECDIDLCEVCFASEEQSSSSVGSSVGSMVSLTKTVAQLHLEGISERSSTELPFNLAKLEPGASGTFVAGLSSLETSSTVAPTDSGASSPRSYGSLHSVKECLSCERPYSGFGTQCGECRKSGASIRQCTECHDYFIGFGTSCEDCRHVPTYETVAERAGMTFFIVPPCN